MNIRETFLVESANSPILIDVAAPPRPVAVCLVVTHDRRSPLSQLVAAALLDANIAALLTDPTHDAAMVHLIDVVAGDARFARLPLLMFDVDSGSTAVLAAAQRDVCAVAAWGGLNVEPRELEAVSAPVALLTDANDVEDMRHSRACIDALSPQSRLICVATNVRKPDAEHASAIARATATWFHQRIHDAPVLTLTDTNLFELAPPA